MRNAIERQVEELNSRSKQLYHAGEYDQAINAAGKSVDLAKLHLGDSYLLAASLECLANVHLTDPDFSQAWELFDEALSVKRRVLGSSNPDLIAELNRLASLHQVSGDYAGAEPLYREVVEIRRVALGEENPLYAASLNNLAGLLQTLGQYGDAARYYTESIAIFRKSASASDESVALGLNNLATLYSHLGRYTDAEALYVEALEIYQEHHAAATPRFARTLNNLAYLYQLLGRYREAENLYKQALEIKLATVGEYDKSYARALCTLAGFYETMGDYASAEPLYKQVIEIDKTALGERSAEYATDLNNLAALYHATAHFEEAEALYKQVIEIDVKSLGKKHTSYGTDLGNLSALYEAMGDYDAALPLAVEALGILQAKLGGSHTSVLDVASNLALLHQRLGQPDTAEKLLVQVLEKQIELLPWDHPSIANTHNSLGFTYFEMANYEASAKHYHQAIKIQSLALGSRHPRLAATLRNLAIVYVATGWQARALVLMRRANAIDDNVIKQIFMIGSESRLTEILNEMHRELNIFLSLIATYPGSPPSVNRLGFEMALRRKRLGTDDVASWHGVLVDRHDVDNIATLDNLADLRRRIAHRTLAGPGDEGSGEHEHLLTQWEVERDLLEAALSQQVSDVKMLNPKRYLDRLDLQSVISSMPAGSTLVEFVKYTPFVFQPATKRGSEGGSPSWKPPRYLAFVLSSGSVVPLQLVDIGEADIIDTMVTTLHDLIANDSEVEKSKTDEEAAAKEYDKSGRSVVETQIFQIGLELSKLVFDPLQLTEGMQKLILVAPDGDLCHLSFEALPSENEGYLSRNYEFRYLRTARDLLDP